MLIDLIAGARPNFMKIAPIIRALKRSNIPYRLIHTGQHFDKAMSEQFFIDLNMPEPDFNLGSGGGTQAEQTGIIMVGYEQVLKEHGYSDLCLVVGDVTSSMACAVVAKKEGIRVAHVEAGIRSGDMKMPEEINRVLIDSITDWFFTTTIAAGENLLKSGIETKNIFFVGNTMIDSLLEAKKQIARTYNTG